MSFTHIQSTNGNANGSSPFTVNLSITPTPGNLLFFVAGQVSDSTTFIQSVVDANNNSWTVITSNTFSTLTISIAYIVAPGNVSSTLTVTMGGAGSTFFWVYDEFSFLNTLVFDTSANAHLASDTGTISTPSITPSANNELFYAAVQLASFNTGTVTGNSPWNTNDNPTFGGTAGLWITSVSSNQAANFTTTNNSGSSWVDQIAAFYTVVPPLRPPGIAMVYDDYQWLGGDEY